MQLHKPTLTNRVGKRLAKPLSRVATARPLCTLTRVTEAYLAFLQGKGSGSGWDMGEEIKAANRLIRRSSPVVFDVGANVGLWSEHFLKTNPNAKIYMFEPAPACRKEIAALKLPGTVLIPCAVGEMVGKGTLHSSEPTWVAASLHKRRDSYFQDAADIQTEVDVTTIDETMQQYSLDFVDFVKMDIEGNELNALKGAAQSLSKRRIGALLFEFGTGNINSRTFFHDFWDLLAAYSLRVSRVTPGGRLVNIPSYYEDLEYFRGATNYVAYLPEKPAVRPHSSLHG